MIHELRTYAIKPEHLAAYLKLWVDLGMSLRGAGQCGQLVGFWVTDSGPLNQVVHIWAYESAGERASLRAALMQEPRWAQEFLPRALPMIERMHSTILQPTSFSPLQ